MVTKRVFDSIVLIIIVLSPLVITTAATATPPIARDQYCAAYLSGKKVGYMHERQRTTSSGLVRVDNKMIFSIDRFGSSLDVVITTESLDKPTGEPVRYSERAKMGNFTMMNNIYSFTKDEVNVTAISAMGQKSQSQYDRPADLLQTTEASRIFMQKFLASGEKTTTFSQVQHSMGKVCKNTLEIIAKERTALIDTSRELYKCKLTQDSSGSKMESFMWMDSEGNTLKYDMNMGNFSLTLISCTKEFAMSKNSSWDVASMTLDSPKQIDNPEKVKVFMAKLSHPADMSFPETGEQTVVKNSAGKTTITHKVNVADRTIPLGQSYSDPEIAKFLKPSKHVESNKPEIKKLANEITANCTSAIEAAEKISSWVDENINPSMSVAYNTAAETLRSKTGDCTEHAVLTAALCRAAGIPARLANGLVYARKYEKLENKFIGHAWNQVYIGDKWVCIDSSYGVNTTRITQLTGNIDFADMVVLLDTSAIVVESVDTITQTDR